MDKAETPSCSSAAGWGRGARQGLVYEQGGRSQVPQGSALPQLVNHCRPTAISWLQLSVLRLALPSCRGWAHRCPLCVSSWCHHAVADGLLQVRFWDSGRLGAAVGRLTVARAALPDWLASPSGSACWTLSLAGLLLRPPHPPPTEGSRCLEGEPFSVEDLHSEGRPGVGGLAFWSCFLSPLLLAMAPQVWSSWAYTARTTLWCRSTSCLAR